MLKEWSPRKMLRRQTCVPLIELLADHQFGSGFPNEISSCFRTLSFWPTRLGFCDAFSGSLREDAHKEVPLQCEYGNNGEVTVYVQHECSHVLQALHPVTFNDVWKRQLFPKKHQETASEPTWPHKCWTENLLFIYRRIQSDQVSLFPRTRWERSVRRWLA